VTSAKKRESCRRNSAKRRAAQPEPPRTYKPRQSKEAHLQPVSTEESLARFRRWMARETGHAMHDVYFAFVEVER
jgi:hypothetical protein